MLDRLKATGVRLRSLTEGLDTSGPMGEAIVTIMAAFAQLERDQLVERTKAGLAVARAVEAGAQSIICASTGNTSASAAAYAAAARIDAVVVLPKGHIAVGKLPWGVAIR